MSVQASSHVWSNSRHSGGSLVVLLCIADHAKADGSGAWPSLAKIAEQSRMTRRHAERVIRFLELSGELLISRGAGPGGTNLYTVLGVGDARRRKLGSAGDKMSLPGEDNMSPGVGTSETAARDISNSQLGTLASPEPKDLTVVNRSIEQSAESEDEPPTFLRGDERYLWDKICRLEPAFTRVTPATLERLRARSPELFLEGLRDLVLQFEGPEPSPSPRQPAAYLDRTLAALSATDAQGGGR